MGDLSRPSKRFDLVILKVGVIGLGVGEQHVAAYARHPNCEVTMVCDLDPQRLEDVANRYEVAGRTVDAAAVTESPDLDVVSICSYDDAHADQCISALKSGKHVMVEKPLALARSDAERILEAQQESDRIVTSNLILRASPRFRELKERVDKGDLGQIFHIEGDYIHAILHKLTEGWRGRMPFYCVTYGGGIHLIDLMRWLLGQEIEEVSGFGSKLLTRDTGYRYEDSTVHIFRFANGAMGKSLTTLGPKHPKFHALNVYGSAGTFVNGLNEARIWTDPDGDPEIIDTPHPGTGKGGLIGDFVEAILEGRSPEVTSVDVFRVMDVCFAAWESLSKGRPIRIPYLI